MRFSLPVLPLLLICLLVSCADKGFPPGGPEDKTPPEITSTSPASGSVMVGTHTEIAVSFSERMDEASIGNALFMSPPPKGGYRVDWKGHDLHLKVADSLSLDRTYVITIGSDAMDAHNNRLPSSFSFAFSTGAQIDSGSIAGTVFQNGVPTGGASLFAYQFADANKDSLLWQVPEYITQSGSDGTFRFQFVSTGQYLVFAVQDKNRNKVWDWEQEQLGFPTEPSFLESRTAESPDIYISMSARKFGNSGIEDAEITQDNILHIKFTTSILRTQLKAAAIEMEDNETKQSIRQPEALVWRDTVQECLLVVTGLSPLKEYTVHVDSLYDLWRNRVSTEKDTVTVQAAGDDTKPPRLVAFSPQSGAKYIPLDASIYLRFDEPIALGGTAYDSVLMSSDSVYESVEINRTGPFEVSIAPVAPLRAGMAYSGHIPEGAIRDLAGNVYSDTLFSMNFAVLNSDSLGAFSGKVELGHRSDNRIPLLFYGPAGGGSLSPLPVEQDLSFKTEVPPGLYRIVGFSDRDADGFISPGRFSPFDYAEPVFHFPDTVSVRPRFETEDVVIDLR